MLMDSTGQQAIDTATAGVIARPPLIFLGGVLLGLVLDRLLPLPFEILAIGPEYLSPAFAACRERRRQYQRISPRVCSRQPASTVGHAIPSILVCFSFTRALA